METLIFLVAFPLLPAALLLIVPNNGVRNIVTRGSFAVIAAASVYLLWQGIGAKPIFYFLEAGLIDEGMFVIEVFLSALIFFLGVKYRNYLASVFVTLQFALMAVYEFVYAPGVAIAHNLFVDKLSIIMALIIGIIGGLICVYALGYMKDFHAHHHDMKDNRPFFFFVLFIFLSAMFGLVFSNSLLWLFFFWEVTTICSFLLIGYTKTPEATRNAFRALVMNLSGGLAFAGAILYLASQGLTLELDKLITSPHGLVMIPVALMCFAGITKSAQMPFSSWLLGAMVAPTPTSALLHSSTMVKAGVYLAIRLAPVISGTYVGDMVALVGGVTFLLAAFMAISQSNAKRVLAYSTISNLGLIIVCAGIGTAPAIWAGIFLIIFHAVAKSLLFLCVGTIEHRIGSRDIEAMGNMFAKMPGMAVMLLIGICGMFIAPFGMLISKWAAIKAFLDVGTLMSPILILILAYGSAVTVFFWAKWMGKIISANTLFAPRNPMNDQISWDEWFSEWAHTVLTVAICLAFPLVSQWLVEPYIAGVYGKDFDLTRSMYMITFIMVVMVILVPAISFPSQRKSYAFGTAYMSGRNTYPGRVFDGSIATRKQATLKNYYLQSFFGEDKFMKLGVVMCSCIILIMFGVAFI